MKTHPFVRFFIRSLLITALCSFALVFTIGCDDNDDDEPTDTETTSEESVLTNGTTAEDQSISTAGLSLGGDWNFSLTPDGSVSASAFAANLNQNVDTIGGTSDGLVVDGLTANNEVNLTFSGSAYMIVMTGVANNNNMSGRFEDSDGATGNWTASR